MFLWPFLHIQPLFKKVTGYACLIFRHITKIPTFWIYICVRSCLSHTLLLGIAGKIRSFTSSFKTICVPCGSPGAYHAASADKSEIDHCTHAFLMEHLLWRESSSLREFEPDLVWGVRKGLPKEMILDTWKRWVGHNTTSHHANNN